MSNQILRNGLIIAGALVVAVLALKFFGVLGHSAANTAQSIGGKF